MGPMTGTDAAPSAGRPWSAVPAAVAHPLKPALPAAIEHVIDVVTKEVPAYSGPDERVAATLRAGVGMALARLVDLMGTDEPALTESAALYERIGAGEYRAGRGLADLLSAYQIGARAAWQSLSRAGVAAGVGPKDVSQLAEAVFAYIDQLSAASIAGYTQAQVADAGRREALRSELVERLLAGEAGSEGVATLAAEVHWPLPTTAMVVVPRGEVLPPALPGALVGRTSQGAVALVAGPITPGLHSWLQAATPEVAVGLPVPLAEAARSLAQARGLVSLRRAAPCRPAITWPTCWCVPIRPWAGPCATRCWHPSRVCPRAGAIRCWPPCAAGCCTRGTGPTWAVSCTFIRRPSATGWTACATCSARASTTRADAGSCCWPS